MHAVLRDLDRVPPQCMQDLAPITSVVAAQTGPAPLCPVEHVHSHLLLPQCYSKEKEKPTPLGVMTEAAVPRSSPRTSVLQQDYTTPAACSWVYHHVLKDVILQYVD